MSIEKNFQKQYVVATVRNRKQCPVCTSPILEVLRPCYEVENICTSYRVRGIKCNYFTVEKVIGREM